jgi:hypothetical protein
MENPEPYMYLKSTEIKVNNKTLKKYQESAYNSNRVVLDSLYYHPAFMKIFNNIKTCHQHKFKNNIQMKVLEFIESEDFELEWEGDYLINEFVIYVLKTTDDIEAHAWVFPFLRSRLGLST